MGMDELMEARVRQHAERTFANIDAWLDGKEELDLDGLRDYCCDRWEADSWQGWLAMAVSELARTARPRPT